MMCKLKILVIVGILSNTSVEMFVARAYREHTSLT